MATGEDVGQDGEALGAVEHPARRRRAVRAAMVLAVAIGVVILVRAFGVQSFVIPSESMEHTLQVGDRVLVASSAYRLGPVRRGDVIVFDGSGLFAPEQDAPSSALASAGRGLARLLGVPSGRSIYVKRVVGLPGERVVCCDPHGWITIDGEPIAEAYLPAGEVPSAIPFDVEVPEGRVWVMGDHRSASADSRAHLGDPGGGTIPLGRIVGRAVAVYWPPDRAGAVHPSGREDHP